MFNRCMLQWFGLGNAQLYAPTSLEEFKQGYDGKVVGLSAMREVYLQFKAPTFSDRHGRFTTKLTPHQHRRLLKYPKGSAYYVAGMFRNLQDFNKAQNHMKQVSDFLKHFVCIRVASLPADACAITFVVPEDHRCSPCPGFKDSEHKSPSPGDFMPLVGESWMRGNTLVEKLKIGSIGTEYRVNREGLLKPSACRSATVLGRSEPSPHALGTLDCAEVGSHCLDATPSGQTRAGRDEPGVLVRLRLEP